MADCASRESALPDLIARLFLREGGAAAAERMDAAHRARIAWEWASGQWVLVAGPDDRLWGFMSWYRCTPEVLDLLRAGDLPALISRGEPVRDLAAGPCVYVATTVVAPWAPPGTYRALFRQVCARNADATCIGAHLNKRDGRARWLHRTLH